MLCTKVSCPLFGELLQALVLFLSQHPQHITQSGEGSNLQVQNQECSSLQQNFLWATMGARQWGSKWGRQSLACKELLVHSEMEAATPGREFRIQWRQLWFSSTENLILKFIKTPKSKWVTCFLGTLLLVCRNSFIPLQQCLFLRFYKPNFGSEKVFEMYPLPSPWPREEITCPNQANRTAERDWTGEWQRDWHTVLTS